MARSRKVPVIPDEETEEDIVLESIETHANVDSIEIEQPEEGEERVGPTRYRITMHAIVAEGAAQQFFATFVRKGKIAIAFLPAEEEAEGRSAYMLP